MTEIFEEKEKNRDRKRDRDRQVGIERDPKKTNRQTQNNEKYI